MKVIAIVIASLLFMPVFAIAAMGQAFAAPEHASVTDSYMPAVSAPGVSGDLSYQVLGHSHIRLTAGARHDVESRRADPRILQILLTLADAHDLGRVGPIATGHSYFVKGTMRVSNHVYGRAVDISAIDGRAVSASNGGAYQAAQTVASLPQPVRPDELGAPWRIPARGVYSFTKGHGDHLHAGFDNSFRSDE